MDSKLLNGCLDVLILEVMAAGPSYGYLITQTVLQRSRGTFSLKEGSLYPALHRLERQAWLESYWEEIEGRRRKYYRLTAAGKKELASRKAEWREFSLAVDRVLGLQQGLMPQRPNPAGA